MKTAVEWLIDTINKINHDYEVGIIDETLWSIQTYDAHKQAKEMEKEQIENAYWEGGQDIPLTEERCKQYYNETFKSE
jgi:hypothetical protein